MNDHWRNVLSSLSWIHNFTQNLTLMHNNSTFKLRWRICLPVSRILCVSFIWLKPKIVTFLSPFDLWFESGIYWDSYMIWYISKHFCHVTYFYLIWHFFLSCISWFIIIFDSQFKKLGFLINNVNLNLINRLCLVFSSRLC